MEIIFKIDIYQNEDQQFSFHMTIQNLQGKTFNLSQLFHSCWIRNNISGYRKKFPDPLHWFDVTYFSAKLVNFSYTVGRNAMNIFTKFGKLWVKSLISEVWWLLPLDCPSQVRILGRDLPAGRSESACEYYTEYKYGNKILSPRGLSTTDIL